MSVLAPAPAPAAATVLRTDRGDVTDGRRWTDPLEAADLDALERCRGPVLDVGCGPARHTIALSRRGTPTLGVDITEPALAWARPRGALVLQRSVFDRLPGTGRWGTVLLLDGNIGIGGDPVSLLRRAVELLADTGVVLVELDPPGVVHRPAQARLEVEGAAGPWFDWQPVGVEQLAELAEACALEVTESWTHDARWFATLARAAS